MIFNKLFNNKINNWSILLVLSTVYMATDINVQGFLSLLPFIQEEFAITRNQAGLYSTFYFLSATMVGVFSGKYVDFIGARKGILYGVSYIGILMMLHSLAPVFSIILILALFTGLGESIITPALNKAMMNVTSPGKRAVSMGITQSGGGIGGFLGATLLPFWGNIFGWRKAILLSGSFAVLVAIFVYNFYQEKDGSNKRDKELFSFKANMRYLLKQRYLIYISCLGFVLGSTGGAVITHFALFLNQDLNLSKTISGFGLGVLQIGGLLGRMVWGGINDKYFVNRRENGLFCVAYVFVILGLILSFSVNIIKIPFLLLLLVIFILGGVSLGWINVYLIIIAEAVKKELQGIATGFGLIFYRFGIVVSPPIFGYIADLKGSYQFSWLILSIFVLLSTIVFYFSIRKIKC